MYLSTEDRDLVIKNQKSTSNRPKWMENDKPENLDYNFSGINTMNIDWCLDTEVIFDMPF